MTSAVVTELLLTAPGGEVALWRSQHDSFQIPHTGVRRAETSQQAASDLVSQLGMPGGLGRLVAVDSQTVSGQAATVHTYTAQPLTPAQIQALGDTAEAATVWMSPEAAADRLRPNVGRRLRHALEGRAKGCVAMEDGWPQIGSAVGLPPDKRAELESVHALSEYDFVAHRPGVWASVVILITDPQGRVLLVEPSYDGRLLMPGGGVEADTGETPRQAAAREWKEELGIPAAVGTLLATDWVSHPDIPRICYVYDGGILGPDALDQIRLPHPELVAWHLVSPDKLGHCPVPGRFASRLHTCLALRGSGRRAVELVNGRLPE
ncbi:NUDIX hydrolase [Streptomyces albus]|uniref:NUDIX hydrolase n=1 Tax=Streptomyces sp. NRRL F-5917 TaxID=1463873 RepID=UPI00099B4565|nr:NUDIX hydrolase [Streptomyces sp. NRRL F-5917]